MSDELSKAIGAMLVKPAQDAAKKQAANADARARRYARKVAEKHGIFLDVEIRREAFGEPPLWSCWICDPKGRFEGDAFCTSWIEVAEKLEQLEDEA